MQLSTFTQPIYCCVVWVQAPLTTHAKSDVRVRFMSILRTIFVVTGHNPIPNSPCSFFSARAFQNVPFDHTIIIISTSSTLVLVKFMLCLVTLRYRISAPYVPTSSSISLSELPGYQRSLQIDFLVTVNFHTFSIPSSFFVPTPFCPFQHASCRQYVLSFHVCPL